ALVAGAKIDRGEYDARPGPHCAVGEIEYPDNRFGILIYIKASMTGDENDYVRFYRQRYPEFPHETTLDQMFSEEQFEVYRALGFHATYRFFNREDEFTFLDPKANQQVGHDLKRLDDYLPCRFAERPSNAAGSFTDRLSAKPAVNIEV